MNIEDKKEELKKLREQEQVMYSEISRLENEIAAEDAKELLVQLKNVEKFIVEQTGVTKIITDHSRASDSINNLICTLGGGGYHFEFTINADYQIRSDDGNHRLRRITFDRKHDEDSNIRHVIQFLKDNGVPADKIELNAESEAKRIKRHLKEVEDDWARANKILEEIYK